MKFYALVLKLGGCKSGATEARVWIIIDKRGIAASKP